MRFGATVRVLARRWPLGAAAILVLLGGSYAGLYFARWEAGERNKAEFEANQRAELKRQADAASAKKAEVQAQATVGSRRNDAAAVAPDNPKKELTLPPNLNKQFSIVQGAGVKGEQYRIVHESTLARCTETCTNEQSCIMFSHWKNGTCYLFNTRFDTYPIATAVVGKLLGERGNAPTEASLTATDKRFRITRDVAVKGDAYRNFRDTTFERCANQCADEPRCKVFAYWKNTSCYLFGEYSDTYPSTETRVGRKFE
jgi:hypothetical protein